MPSVSEVRLNYVFQKVIQFSVTSESGVRSRHRGDESSSLHALLHEERDGVQHE